MRQRRPSLVLALTMAVCLATAPGCSLFRMRSPEAVDPTTGEPACDGRYRWPMLDLFAASLLIPGVTTGAIVTGVTQCNRRPASGCHDERLWGIGIAGGVLALSMLGSYFAGMERAPECRSRQIQWRHSGGNPVASAAPQGGVELSRVAAQTYETLSVAEKGAVTRTAHELADSGERPAEAIAPVPRTPLVLEYSTRGKVLVVDRILRWTPGSTEPPAPPEEPTPPDEVSAPPMVEVPDDEAAEESGANDILFEPDVWEESDVVESEPLPNDARRSPE